MALEKTLYTTCPVAVIIFLYHIQSHNLIRYSDN